MGRVKTKVTKNHKKTPKLKRFYCTICKVLVKQHSDPETVVRHHETIIKWTEQCCAVICKVFQLESINDCYRLVLQKGRFCGSCIELMREVELSVREVAKLESKMMKTIKSLKCQFKNGLRKYNLTQNSIDETMKQMENFENETELWDWYTSRRGNTCRDPFFPAICLSKIAKNKIRCDEENFQDRQNYFNNASFVDLFSYKALHLPELETNETAFNFDGESLSGDFGDYYSTFEPEETDNMNNLPHSLAPSSDNDIDETHQTLPTATISKFEANGPVVEDIVSESVENLDLDHQPKQTQEISKTPEKGEKSDGKTKKRKRNTNKPRKKWVKRLPNRLSCPHCRVSFVKKKYLLENHIRSVHLGEPDGFHCPEEGCDKRFSNSAKLGVHMSYYHKSNCGPTVCDKCGGVFQSQHLLKSHKWNTDCGREEDPFKCVLCFFRLTDDASFKEHMDKHKSFATVSPFRCVFCPQVCPHVSALKKHTYAQHVPNTFKCSFCYRVFRTVYNCKRHEKEHTNKAYKCSVCGKTTASDPDLKQHMEIHSANRKRLQCTQCSANYFRKSHLKAHMVKKHSTNAPIYNCQLCDKSYRDKNTLRRHVQRHSGIQHTCKHCNKSFKCPSYLAQHLRGHCPAKKPGASQKSDKSKSSRQEQSNEFVNPQPQQLTKVTQVFSQSGPSLQMNNYDTQQVFVPTNSIMPVNSVGLASFPCHSTYDTQYSYN